MLHRHFLKTSKRLGATLLLSTMLVVGCQTTRTPISGIDFVSKATICEAFPNITYSRTDSEATRKQIVEFNAARDKLCRG